MQIPQIVANLCVSYIMVSQKEKSEDLMRRVEEEEEMAAADERLTACKAHNNEDGPLGLSIVNLAIGTLYCAKDHHEFGITRDIFWLSGPLS